MLRTSNISPSPQPRDILCYYCSVLVTKSTSSKSGGTFPWITLPDRVSEEIHPKKPRNSPGREPPAGQSWHSLIPTPTPKTSLGMPFAPQEIASVHSPGPSEGPQLCQLAASQRRGVWAKTMMPGDFEVKRETKSRSETGRLDRELGRRGEERKRESERTGRKKRHGGGGKGGGRGCLGVNIYNFCNKGKSEVLWEIESVPNLHASLYEALPRSSLRSRACK